MRGRRWLLLSVLFIWSPAEARVFFAWDFPRDYQPIPAFLLVLEPQQGTPQPLTVPYTPAGTCTTVPGTTADTFCTELTPCPTPGIYTITAYAWWQGNAIKSGPSNSITVQIVASPSCAAVNVDILTAPPPPAAKPPVPCNKAEYQPQYLPVPTTTEQPAPVVIEVPAAPVETPPPPLPQRTITPAPVRQTAPVITPRVAPKPVLRAGNSAPVASATVYAGSPTEVPFPPPPPPPALPPCQ